MPPTRTKPWPFDLRLAFVQPALGGPADGVVYDPAGEPVPPGKTGPEYGLMTADGHVARRVDPLGTGTFPEAQEYATSDVYKERSFVYRRSYLGMGERTQNGATTPRYYYAWNAQTYLTMRGKGPRWHPVDTGSATEGPALGFVEGLHGTPPALTMFVLAGRYVRRHAGDLPGQSAESLDLGPGVYARSATRWRTRGPSPLEFLYLTDSSDRVWRYDGAVWDDVTTEVGSHSLLWSTRDELWGSTGHFVHKNEGDPMVGGDWTAPVPCGDGLAPVNGMTDIAGAMFFFLDDGSVWSMLSDTSTQNLFRGLETSRSDRNGRNPAQWLNQIFFRSAETLYRISGGVGGAPAQFNVVGPERVQTNTSPVRGAVGAFCGAQGYYAFAGQYNPYTTTPDGFSGPVSYLLRYGNWVPSEGDEEGIAAFVDAYDGAQVVWAGKEITSLAYTDAVSVTGAMGDGVGVGNPRLFAGFSDGTYGWVYQPKGGPNPFDPEAGCDFTDQLSFLRWPRHSMDAPADLKGYLSFDVTGPYLDPYRWVNIQYRVDPAGEDTAWSQLARSMWQTSERVMFPYPTLGKVIEIREDYGSAAPPDPAPPQPSPHPPGPTLADWTRLTTPVVASMILREQLRPAYRGEYAFTVRATDWAPRRDGGTSRLTAPQIKALLQRAADAPATLRILLPDESAGDFTLVSYRERMPQAAKFQRYGQSTLIDVTAVAYRTQRVLGIVERFFDDLVGELSDELTIERCDEL
jgi:hypothetical protein